ncbi:MAG: bifunctional [glutamate--ammonia ligase]-adenylyl-L-tyrosine phosphorylase/[glutamate--ammonia-ligase] adenylyltransferase [Gammaproteobacteria bacterium]
MFPTNKSPRRINKTHLSPSLKKGDEGGRGRAGKEFLATLPVALRERVERDWQGYAQSASEANVQAPAHPDLLNVLYRVWAYSEFVAQTCTRHPQLFADLLKSGDLLIDYAASEYEQKAQAAVSNTKNEQELGASLRHLRTREMLRIGWRDLAGWADLHETLADLSALAAACIEAALDKLHAWQSKEFGVPQSASGIAQSMMVIGMGKLGARELNFSSDIDLIFAYPEDGETQGKRPRMTNEEYFIRLAQRLINALAAVTADGLVYRVDMRLRPFGDSGPLVLSFGALEDYYQNHGREWERYAMVKARVVAGDEEQGKQLMDMLRPFIYRRYLDFGVFEALREMKEMIVREAQRRGLQDNIKLGQGGIREIEFIGQLFQLIRGGRDTRLQEPGILRVLEYLGQANYLPVQVSRQLSDAYIFLRKVENRLQEFADEQTHTLPTDETDRARLALSMKYENWLTFQHALVQYTGQVHTHFVQIFKTPQISRSLESGKTAGADLNGLWQGTLDETQAAKLLEAAGFTDAPEAVRLLNQLHQGHHYRALSDRGRRRMDSLMPLLVAAVGAAEQADVTLMRLVNLIEAIAQRTAYLALLVENPLALSQLVKLCAASPWISALLTRHPLLLDELLDTRRLYSPLDRANLESELRQILLRIPEHDLEQQMEALRNFKQVHVLRVAAADTAGVLPLMIVSDYLTAIAELILQQVLNLAWHHLVARHGDPNCLVKGKPYTAGFAIVAYGKLGGIELGYGSDLDIVFLHDTEGEGQHTAGPKSIDNTVFFARLGQRIVHILNAHTPAGVLYEVDVRLRPSGASGLLVSSLESFADYQRTRAWTWEHQALVRARVVAEQGDNKIAVRFDRLRAEILQRPREANILRAEVHDMRERMRTALGTHEAGRFDVKQDEGGIADIEFMVQYDVLLWAHDYPALLTYTDNIRQLQGLAEAGLMSTADVQLLTGAYRAYRSAVHRCALQDEPAQVARTEFAEYRAGVIRIWKKLLA